MKFYAYITLFVIALFGGTQAFALKIAEKPLPVDSTQSAPDFQRDTLVDLNAQLKGVKEITFPKDAIIPDAIEITPQGVIILKSTDLMKAESYAFELKAVSNIDEVYIVQVNIKRENGKYLVSTVSDKIDMATGFRAEGKIYIVVVVCLILFTVVITYLTLMDRRMRKINARIENRNNTH